MMKRFDPKGCMWLKCSSFIFKFNKNTCSKEIFHSKCMWLQYKPVLPPSFTWWEGDPPPPAPPAGPDLRGGHGPLAGQVTPRHHHLASHTAAAGPHSLGNIEGKTRPKSCRRTVFIEDFLFHFANFGYFFGEVSHFCLTCCKRLCAGVQESLEWL